MLAKIAKQPLKTAEIGEMKFFACAKFSPAQIEKRLAEFILTRARVEDYGLDFGLELKTQHADLDCWRDVTSVLRKNQIR